MKYSIILPCRNEEAAIAFCITSIQQTMKKAKIRDYEIIVSDSSVDSSPKIAQKLGAKVVKHDKEGYGMAYLEGFKAAAGNYVICMDADLSYDSKDIPKFINYLSQGYDFVIGNRFKGKIDKGAMSWSHKYIGNPVLSGVLRLFFRAKIHDAHSGMRALTKRALEKLNLKTAGMEFASEMIIKAIKNNLKIKEIPVGYHRRKGVSKLKPFGDAWRHLRFMLLYSPLFLFFIPGILLILTGLVSMLWFYAGVEISRIKFFYHPMFISSLIIIIGYQLIIFGLFAKTYALNHLGDKSKLDRFYRYLTIEKATIFGILLSLLGIAIYAVLFIRWVKTDFNAFTIYETKDSIIALTLFIIGIQTIFSSFVLSILGIKEK